MENDINIHIGSDVGTNTENEIHINIDTNGTAAEAAANAAALLAQQAAAAAASAATSLIASAEEGRVTAEEGRVTAEEERVNADNARNTKLGNLSFDMEMLAPSADPYAVVTQDSDSIDVTLHIPASNLAYATFAVSDDMELIMTSPDGFDDIGFQVTDDGEMEVTI